MIADGIRRVEEGLDLQLPYPAERVATGHSAAINGLAFERVADAGTGRDELFAFIV